tara:strand:+ start:385 stop:1035 length:651 start_codon:yes stop_codon:yes gene_type:complete
MFSSSYAFCTFGAGGHDEILYGWGYYCLDAPGEPNSCGVNDRDKRKDYASALLKYTQKLSNQLSRISPKELDWLANELNAGGKRQINALYSEEYSRRMGALFFDSLIKLFSEIQSPELDAYIKNHHNGLTDLTTKEASLWALAVEDMTNQIYHEILGRLFHAGTLDADIDEKYRENYVSLRDYINIAQTACVYHAHNIHENIISPFMRYQIYLGRE